MTFRLGYYEAGELASIVLRSSRILDVDIEEPAAVEIASRARGTPRVANRILRRIRDVAQVRHAGAVTLDIAREALELLEVDEAGLERTDRELLSTIVGKFGGGPWASRRWPCRSGRSRTPSRTSTNPSCSSSAFSSGRPGGVSSRSSAGSTSASPHLPTDSFECIDTSGRRGWPGRSTSSSPASRGWCPSSCKNSLDQAEVRIELADGSRHRGCRRP